MKILDVLANNTYDPVLNLYGYAYRIARNAISTYLYHDKKLVTLTNEEFPDIPSHSDFDSNLLLEDALEQTLHQFKTSLPKEFTKQDLLNLLFDDKDPDSLLLTVVKGDLIWRLSK